MDLPNNIIIRERKEALVSGVKEVLSFDDLQIEAETTGGTLALQGSELKILGLDTKNGELRVTGKIDRAFYVESRKKKTGLWEALRK